MDFDNLRCIFRRDLMLTGILILKKFLLSILKFLEADSTEWEGNDADPGL